MSQYRWKTLFAVLLILSFVPLVVAQETNQTNNKILLGVETINPKLPQFTFKLESSNDGNFIIISGGPKNYKGQRFDTIADESNLGFHTVDINFDGFKDFRVVWNRGNHGNVDYETWIYDPKVGLFKEAPEFNEITHIDFSKKLLISHLGARNSSTENYYCLKNGNLQIVKSDDVILAQEARDIVPASYADDESVEIARFYKNGKLQRTFYQKVTEP